jgi:pimeloyl-ACP methyl ester carboxylesterase
VGRCVASLFARDRRSSLGTRAAPGLRCGDTYSLSAAAANLLRSSLVDVPAPARHERFIDLQGLSFRYWELGLAEAAPVALLHALGAGADDWLDIGRALSDHWRVIAFDQRGHGGSARPGQYSFELMRDDLATLVAALELVDPILIGHSMGGSVAYLYAEAFPDRVRRLVIEDTPPPFPANLPEPETIPENLAFDGRLLVSIIRQLNAPDPAWWDRLGAIQAPLLIIGGGSTSPIPQDKLAAVVARVPHGRLLTIEGAGHHVHRTRPTEFLTAVREFLSPPQPAQAHVSTQGEG